MVTTITATVTVGINVVITRDIAMSIVAMDTVEIVAMDTVEIVAMDIVAIMIARLLVQVLVQAMKIAAVGITMIAIMMTTGEIIPSATMVEVVVSQHRLIATAVNNNQPPGDKYYES
jgi:hypothetical protein